MMGIHDGCGCDVCTGRKAWERDAFDAKQSRDLEVESLKGKLAAAEKREQDLIHKEATLTEALVKAEQDRDRLQAEVERLKAQVEERCAMVTKKRDQMGQARAEAATLQAEVKKLETHATDLRVKFLSCEKARNGLQAELDKERAADKFDCPCAGPKHHLEKCPYFQADKLRADNARMREALEQAVGFGQQVASVVMVYPVKTLRSWGELFLKTIRPALSPSDGWLECKITEAKEEAVLAGQIMLKAERDARDRDIGAAVAPWRHYVEDSTNLGNCCVGASGEWKGRGHRPGGEHHPRCLALPLLNSDTARLAAEHDERVRAETAGPLVALLREWHEAPYFDEPEGWQKWVEEFGPRVDAALESDTAQLADQWRREVEARVWEEAAKRADDMGKARDYFGAKIVFADLRDWCIKEARAIRAKAEEKS